MAHDREHPEPRSPHRVIAERVREVRTARGLTAASLAQRMTAEGVGWDRSVVANLENGRRSTVSVEELLALARVLEVAPVNLVVPLDDDGWLAITPETGAVNELARAWIRGTRALPGTDERRYFSEVPESEWRRSAQLQREAERELEAAGVISISRVRQRQPVVAAIVTSARGVLIGRRNDATPPWTFIAGEVKKDPAERPEDAAVREVKEETGLDIRAGSIIGERDHPATGRHMIYVAARPAGRSTRIVVGDEAELAEVRWVGLAEADELLPGMFGLVREHLVQVLGDSKAR